MRKLNRFLLLATACSFLGIGCTAHKQNRTNFTPTGHLGTVEENPDLDAISDEVRDEVRHRVFEKYDRFLMAHVEFDDQGQFWETERDGERNQLDALEQHIRQELKSNRSKYAKGAVIVAFVHGWNNNSVEGNDNLDNFRRIMQRLAGKETQDRQLIGVYLSWRGLKVRDIPVVSTVPNFFTYWDRKETAQNIGKRTMGETLKRLSFLKDDIVEKGERRRHRDARSRLVLVGHSFGGAAVFSGVSRFFEDELIKVKRSGYEDYVDRNWDLVMLVNPAFEALPYGSIHRYNAEIPPQAPNPFVHLPRLLVVGAENDTATGMALPIGQTVGDLFRRRQHTPHLDQQKRMITALGHYKPFMTHRLDPEGETSGVLRPYKQFENLGGTPMAAYAPGRQQEFLRTFDDLFADNAEVKRVLPFMVVQADSEVVDGHNGIWKPRFTKFVIDFIVAREEAVMQLGR